MAKIFIDPDNPDNCLRVRYQLTFWRALVAHAPSVLAYLREHGVDEWLERYGLPREPWHQVGTDYLDDPHTVELRNFWYSDAPPPIPDFKAVPYDPSRMTRQYWEQRAQAALHEYRVAVERAYTAAGWQRVRTKYEPQHFVWLALRLELSDPNASKSGKKEKKSVYKKIADHLGLAVYDDTIRKGVQAVAELLGVRLAQTPRKRKEI